MSIWKKIIGQTDLTPEEREKIELEKKAKKEQRELEFKRYQEEQDRKREAKRIEKEKRKAAELESIIRFFGPNPGMGVKLTYSTNKETFDYVETHLLQSNEKVLGTIQAEYDKTSKREIKGILIASDQKLIFAFVRGANQYTEEFDYSKMRGISLAKDGFASKELYIDYGRGRKKFDDIIDDDYFKKFLGAVNDKIVQYRNAPKTKSPQKKAENNSGDKYKQLEQIAKLKEQGILSDEEFQIEKKKILE